MKLRIKNEFGVPLNLQGVDSIKIIFPYHSGKTLEKTKVDILDAGDGKINVELSDFEIQGLNVGMKQDFWGYVTRKDEAYKVVFKGGLNVTLDEESGRKAIA